MKTLLLAWMVALCPVLASADTITLAWDPSTTIGVDSYTMYVGTQPGPYTETFVVGDVLTFSYTTALPGQPYCFAVSASIGALEGAKSTEVCGGTNSSPSLTHPGNQTSAVGQSVSLPLQASDPQGQALTFSAVGLPPTLTISPILGVIAGTTTIAGFYAPIVTVTDTGGLSASQSLTWTVTTTPPPPSSVITARYAASASGSAPRQTTTGTFTPAANSTLYLVAWAQESQSSGSTALTVASNTGGLTFTRLIQSAELSTEFGGRMALFSAPVGASPSSMRVTVDAGTGTKRGWIALGAFDVAGTPTVRQLVAKVESENGGNATTHTTATLPLAVTSGHLVVACFGANNDSTGAVATPAGWTPLFATSAIFESIACFYRSDFIGTSVMNPDLGQDVSASGSIVMEVQ